MKAKYGDYSGRLNDELAAGGLEAGASRVYIQPMNSNDQLGGSRLEALEALKL